METPSFGTHLGQRIPLHDELEPPFKVLGMKAPSRIMGRASKETEDCSDPNLCEKPISQKDLALPISLGVVIPVVIIIGVLIYLHRRNVKKVRREDDDDPNGELDFGLGGEPSAVSNLRRSIFGEKGGAHKQQLSMDMNMSTPYLLPPELHESRESLHTLAHSVQSPEDRYKPMGGSDVGSIRSARRGPGGDNASLYTTSSRTLASREPMSPPPTMDLPRPPPAAADPFPRHHTPSSPQSPVSRFDPNPITPPEPRHDPFMAPSEANQPHAQSTPYPDARAPASPPPKIDIPISTMPPTIDIALSPQERKSPPMESTMMPMSAKIEMAADDSLPSHPEPQQAQIGHVRSCTSSTNGFSSPPPQSPPPQNAAAHDPSPQVHVSSAHDSIYSDYNPRQSYQQNNAGDDEEPRGRPRSRFPDDAQRGSQFLAAPQPESRRLSVGFRPLPPDEIMDTEDPEHRANRIRSFYKEYFEVENPQAQPPLPGPVPAALVPQAIPPQPAPQAQPPPQSQGDYYEDYDGAYLENTYVDPNSNSFVTPYAQPVHRRAMTPPPRGPRMRGPPPPRVMHGSMGGISLPGSRSPLRPGSATSSRLGPRPDSSASARIGPRGRPRPPPGPPPAALTTLPNPAKLGDDTFALMSASDFAPPDTFKDRARGRSQSPVPEKRPYRLGVPVHSPLASAYDELAAVPSPHMLRKSGTFTGLDFAPPKRFKDDGDTMSDAGSIRSNRSGLSAMNQAALRGGAGRVSRLPGDTVFTAADMGEQLRPSWDMRT